ncbi:MAG TPA: hypothetical protein PLN56_11485 [Methanoregulaceae archaeon]|jgi:hypothetical protein|nr:hypothetical protein [Methanoregulaceae archaeon]
MKQKGISGILTVFLALVLWSAVLIPTVSAYNEFDENANLIGITVPAPEQFDVSSYKESINIEERDDGLIIDDTFIYLNYWNKILNWGQSEEEIKKISNILEDQVLIKYYDVIHDYYAIKDIDKFGEELGSSLGLNAEETRIFIESQKEQLIKDYQNFDLKDYPSEKTILDYISPSSQSAPFAIGKLYYLYIITDFQIPSSDGPWTVWDRNDAMYDSYLGTMAIQMQAPGSANVVNDGGYYIVTVSGENSGDNIYAWGVNGWMEEAARNIGYYDSNGDGRTTDDMARSIKTWSGADSVIVLYYTHDDMGAYAVGPDQGYADKGAISYWGRSIYGRFSSVPGSYEHESLHLYGALDEYAGASYCGQQSILSVSPMHEMYSNTNHVNCPYSTNSVMRDPYSTNGISLSSMRFIGWGDYDSDGILDPLDGTPWG